MSYINKQQILDRAKSLQGSPFGAVAIVQRIENAEGVDIVFCKECKHWRRIGIDGLIGKDFGYCHNNDFPFMCETRPDTKDCKNITDFRNRNY